MVAPKLPCAHNGGSYFSRFCSAAAHSLFIPPEALFGSAIAGAANA
jgi:hypothetical protein